MTRTAFFFAALLAAAPVLAQAPSPAAAQAQLRVTVLDQTGAGIPSAIVTVTASGSAPIKVTGDERGLAVLAALPAAGVQLHVEAPGFEPSDAMVTLRRGANTQTVTLKIEGFQEQVVVDDAAVEQAPGSAETTKVLDESVIDQLPDDPDELQAMLEQMAGGLGAVFRVNGFTGGRLPNREDIRQIRFRTNSFAADSHDAGRVQVEIITRPNVQRWNGNFNANVRNDVLNARDAFAATKTPQNIMRLGTGVRGPLVAGRTSLRLNMNGNRAENPSNIYAINPDGSRFVGFVSNRTQNTNGTIGVEHALTRNQTLRVDYELNRNETLNGGAGGFNLPERATNRHGTNGQLRAQVQGLIGRSTLNEFHVEYVHVSTVVESASKAVSVNVLDAFNAGGAGINNSARTRTFEAADNLDFTIGRKHAMRVGVLVTGGRYRNFDARNAAGTFTFSSLESYLAATPLQFTQRIGEVDTSFTAYQGAVYWQDDIRATRTLTISVGVREELQSLIATKLNLMPRVGLTYSPRNSRTIVRGGYGLFYDWYESNLYDQTLRVNGIAQRDLRINCPGFPDPFAPAVATECRAGLGAGVPLVQPGGRIQASPNLVMPHVHQASVSIERPIGTSFRTAAGYQMLRGRNQMRARDVNTPDPITGLRPEPAIGSVTQFDSTGRSARDSFNVNLGYAMPRRQINLGMNYTLARFRNHADNATQLPVDSYHPDLEWGPSAQDIRHRLQANLFLPPVRGFRLAVNGLVYQSGAPYNITTGVDDNHDLVINDRPLDATGRMIGRNSARGAARWGDMTMRLTRAFVFGAPTPRAQQQGGARGGGGFQQATGRFNLEFFAQADNVLNRVNFTSYAGTMTSRLFGQPTAASQARRVQLGFQFRF
ncbi:MAG TPA: carboxypeptidase-like regulatory domain-containing protein [Vicinamibacterales bacterium]|nr:carboxypeptidase-like regulatory domain-containing protein [Vicinamibacterales bacterium]